MPTQGKSRPPEEVFGMEPSSAPSAPDRASPDAAAPRQPASLRDVTAQQWITVGILCFVNLINYMDRVTLAGILDDVKQHFSLTEDEAGLIHTSFVISYMVFAPLFGYLGDRYNRKAIMIFGVIMWGLTTLLGSFMNHFGSFIAFRALVGIGEASYTTITPTIISDMFVQDLRSTFLALFYFAIPVGSGLGYIVGSKAAEFFGAWQYSLRVTPVLGTVAAILIIFVMKEPKRGHSESAHNLVPTAWKEDCLYLLKNKTYIYSSLGFTCVSFVTGALSWWVPTYLFYGSKLQVPKPETTKEDIALIFGVLAMISGALSVPAGVQMSKKLRPRFPRVDSVLCGISVILATYFLFGAVVTIQYTMVGTYILTIISLILMNLNWAIVTDILLYVVIPTRRSTAVALQILFTHAFGDASSPYIVGLISQFLQQRLAVEDTRLFKEAPQVDSFSNPDYVRFKAFQYAFFGTCFVELLGGIFFLVSAVYILRDKARCSEATSRVQSPKIYYADEFENDYDQQDRAFLS